jgi:hypothetical protein
MLKIVEYIWNLWLSEIFLRTPQPQPRQVLYIQRNIVASDTRLVSGILYAKASRYAAINKSLFETRILLSAIVLVDDDDNDDIY